MKALLLVFLVVGASLAFANPSGKRCGKAPSWYRFSVAQTVDEIERSEMAKLPEMQKVRPDMPEVPFGFAHPGWIAFKSQWRPGDKIVEYTTDARSWQHLAGEAGYALIRSGCVITRFVTMQN